MQAQPRLIPISEPDRPDAAVLVLHGGANRPDNPMVSPTQLSVIRMIPTARAVVRHGRDRLAVYRLLNTHRGWDNEHTPVRDATWAMARVAERYGDLPVALIGHSLGGRAALLAGAGPAVQVVVALNPWVYNDDGVPLPGRSVLFVHGQRDRIAIPSRSEAVARRVARSTDVGYIRIPGGKHAMLRHGRDFDRYAAEFVAGTLITGSSREQDRDLSAPVRQVLAGEAWVTA